jgi:hypothetical protein
VKACGLQVQSTPNIVRHIVAKGIIAGDAGLSFCDKLRLNASITITRCFYLYRAMITFVLFSAVTITVIARIATLM